MKHGGRDSGVNPKKAEADAQANFGASIAAANPAAPLRTRTRNVRKAFGGTREGE